MPAAASDTREPRLGRYVLCGKIAAGGMATVHFGRLVGEGGFSRVVAIKRMGSHLAEDPEFRAMFLDEARLAARIRHPNVVSTIDVGSSSEGLFLVMEYVAGESLASLLRIASARGERLPVPIALRVVADTLYGLHAAHVATDDHDRPLSIVHRDVSPQNILVATDGLSRVLDFGIAKAAGSIHTTREGQLKGKLRYMAPEQVKDEPVTPRTDVYSAAVVLWESLTTTPLFAGSNDAAVVARVIEGVVAPPSKWAPAVTGELDRIVLRGLARDPDGRFPTARAMAEALEALGTAATARQVGAWVEEVAAEPLARRGEQLARVGAGEEAPGRAADPKEPATSTRTLDVGIQPVDVAPTEVVPFAALGPPGARSRAGLAWVLAIAAVVALSALGLAKVRAVGDARAAAEPSASTAPLAAPSAASTPDPSVTAPPAASSVAERVAAPRPQVPTPSVRPTRAKPSVPARASCTPPYYEDPSGIRRVKPECL